MTLTPEQQREAHQRKVKNTGKILAIIAVIVLLGNLINEDKPKSESEPKAKEVKPQISEEINALSIALNERLGVNFNRTIDGDWVVLDNEHSGEKVKLRKGLISIQKPVVLDRKMTRMDAIAVGALDMTDSEMERLGALVKLGEQNASYDPYGEYEQMAFINGSISYKVTSTASGYISHMLIQF